MATAPKHIYEAIEVLATDLVNASAANNKNVYRVLFTCYQRLCLQQLRAGIRDPFLLETIADFATEHAMQIKFYRRAIALARRQRESTCSALLGLGEAYAAGGRVREARKAFEAAIRESKKRRDSECEAEAMNRLKLLQSPRRRN